MRLAAVLGLLHAGLALVRALGRAGVPVSGAALQPREFGLVSRYLDGRAVVEDADPGRRDELVVAALRKMARGERLVLFAERDEHVELVLRRFEEIRGFADVPLPDDLEAIRRLRRKELLPLAAEEAGVPAPHTLLAADEAAIRNAELRPPFLVKPAEGQAFAHAFGEKAVVARSVEDAVAAWRRAHEHGFDTIVQELVPDSHERVFSLFTYIGRDGEPLADVVGRKVRQGPLRFGTSAVFEVRYEPRVLELGHRLLASVGYRGFAHVELAEDPRDGEFKLLEVNTRPPVWGGIAMTPGYDVARLAYDDLCGVAVRPLGVLTEPRTWIYFAKDAWVSAQMARRRELGPRRFAAPYLGGRKVRATFAADDLRPVLASLAYLRTRV